MPDLSIAAPAAPLLAVRQVSRRFGYRPILREVTFEVQGGEALLLAGPNGAGKTTLLRVLAGLLGPSQGTVERRGTLGLVAHHAMVYDALSARENLAFFGRLHGLPRPERADLLLDRLGLATRADEPVAGYSRGMVQRVAIARALLHDPSILLLDEPLSHLDEESSRVVVALLAELRSRGRALVIVSHQLAELAGLATHVGLLTGGRLAALEPRAGRDGPGLVERFRAVMAGG